MKENRAKESAVQGREMKGFVFHYRVFPAKNPAMDAKAGPRARVAGETAGAPGSRTGKVLEGTTIWSREKRVYGGCLGVSGRRRPRQAAKIGGEEQISFDPPVAEWGNPTRAILLSIVE